MRGLCLAAVLAAVTGAGASTGVAVEKSATQINKDVADPVSTTWSLKLKNKVLFLDIAGHGDPVEYELKFQPTMPVLLTPRLKLITRPEFTLVDDTPFVDQQGELDRTTGVGDTVLDLALSPVWGPWLAGLGPTFVFPTANLDETGQGKWQAGPAAVAGYRAKTWLAYLIFQQWWSFAGASDRSSVSELHLQYSAYYFLGDGWSIGTAPTIEVKWRADPGEQVLFPFGPTIAKVVRVGGTFPIKFELEGLYAPIHPPNDEQFAIQLTIIPVVHSP